MITESLKKILFEKVINIKNQYNLDDKLYGVAKDFLFLICDENIVADRITDLYEKGYAFKFTKNKNSDIEIWFEIYEDYEFGYIAFNKNNYQVIANEDIKDFKLFIQYLKD